MKLVEILAKGRDKLNCQIDLDFEWFSATQVSDGDVCFSLNEKGTLQAHMDLNICKADDWVEAIVTRAQWEAERARIATNQQSTQEAREIAQDESKRSKEDQALWDDVAIGAMRAYMAQPKAIGDVVVEEFVGWGVEVADAFMEERAKRLDNSHTTNSTNTDSPLKSSRVVL